MNNNAPALPANNPPANIPVAPPAPNWEARRAAERAQSRAANKYNAGSMSGFSIEGLKDKIQDASDAVKAQLAKFDTPNEEINIKDMFEMQIKMNHLNQLSDMTSGVVAATNAAIKTMTSNMRG